MAMTDQVMTEQIKALPLTNYQAMTQEDKEHLRIALHLHHQVKQAARFPRRPPLHEEATHHHEEAY